MSRSSLAVLLALCASLLGSTCEFRASSGKHECRKDCESGVSVIVDTRVGGSSGGTAAGAFDPAEIVQAALAASGAPPIPEAATAGQGAASAPAPVAAPGLALVRAQPAEAVAVGAIPEPTAVRLFGLGLVLAGLAWSRRRRARS